MAGLGRELVAGHVVLIGIGIPNLPKRAELKPKLLSVFRPGTDFETERLSSRENFGWIKLLDTCVEDVQKIGQIVIPHGDQPALDLGEPASRTIPARQFQARR
jgi:hypothetical protein